MQCLPIHTFFASYLGSRCIEVPLKENFLLMVTKKSVPQRESSTYPGSQLSKSYWFNLVRKFKGPRNLVPVTKTPTYAGSHLT